MPKNIQTTAQLHSSHMLARRRQWHPTPVLLHGKSHGQRSLVGCSPWGREESDTTEQLHFHFSLSCIGEGNGNPFRCSCWRIPGMGEPGGLPSMGSHRVGHDWSDLAAVCLSLEEKMATWSSILVWKIPWTEEPCGLQSIGSQIVRHDWANTHAQCIYINPKCLIYPFCPPAFPHW